MFRCNWPMFQGTKTEDAKLLAKCWFQTQGSPQKNGFPSKQTNKQTKIDENSPQSGPKKSTFEKTARIWRLTPDVRGHEWIIPLDRLCLVGFPGNCLVKGVTMSMVTLPCFGGGASGSHSVSLVGCFCSQPSREKLFGHSDWWGTIGDKTGFFQTK